MVVRGTGARRALVQHHNLQDLVLEANGSLELSERVPTEQRNPEVTEDVMASDSSRKVSNSGVSRESVRMESKPCSKSATA